MNEHQVNFKQIKKIVTHSKINARTADNCNIYFLLNNDEIVYIGISKNSLPSLYYHEDKTYTHISIPSFEDYGFDGTVQDLYFDLVFKLKPIYNTTLPKNDRYMTKYTLKKKLYVTDSEIDKALADTKVKPVYLNYYDVEEIKSTILRLQQLNQQLQ